MFSSNTSLEPFPLRVSELKRLSCFDAFSRALFPLENASAQRAGNNVLHGDRVVTGSVQIAPITMLSAPITRKT
jgi:hypothetical protein